MIGATSRRTVRCGSAVFTAALLGVLPFAQVQASTIAVFSWVQNSGSGPQPESGSLTLTLPGTITTNQFSSPGATFAEVTGFNYTFSSGVSVNLSNLTGVPTITTPPDAWATATVGPTTVGGTGLGTTDLITGFVFSGPSSLKISESQGTLTNIALASNQINPAAGGVANDSGWWELTSLRTTTVPVPPALGLLLSGLGVLATAFRRRIDTPHSPAVV